VYRFASTGICLSHTYPSLRKAVQQINRRTVSGTDPVLSDRVEASCVMVTLSDALTILSNCLTAAQLRYADRKSPRRLAMPGEVNDRKLGVQSFTAVSF
jgi:hypothetical protein